MQIKIKIHGNTSEVTYESGDSILDCAIKNDLNPPYSCMEGVCASCCAKLISGKVEHPDDTILSDEQVAAGEILTCQARLNPLDGNVVIDYDAVWSCCFFKTVTNEW